MPRAMLRRARIERWITYVLWAVMVAMLAWMAWTWAAYLELRAEQAEAQTEHMAELLERSARRQEQMATLIREFRASVEDEKASRQEFEVKADAILKALDVQVERMSHKPAGSTLRVRRIVGQAGARPRARQPPEETEPTHDHPPKHEHPPKPKPRAQPAPPPRSQPPPQASNPPKAKRPSSASSQTAPSRPGKADPPGKAKGHSKQPPAKGRR